MTPSARDAGLVLVGGVVTLALQHALLRRGSLFPLQKVSERRPPHCLRSYSPSHLAPPCRSRMRPTMPAPAPRLCPSFRSRSLRRPAHRSASSPMRTWPSLCPGPPPSTQARWRCAPAQKSLHATGSEPCYSAASVRSFPSAPRSSPSTRLVHALLIERRIAAR